MASKLQGTYPIKPSLPAIGGGEGVGEVLSVGPEVKNLKIGDWVFPGGNMRGTKYGNNWFGNLISHDFGLPQDFWCLLQCLA